MPGPLNFASIILKTRGSPMRYIEPCNKGSGIMIEDDATGHPDRAPDRVLSLLDNARRQPGRALADMRSYWTSLRQGRAVPARQDVTPAGLRHVLPHAFIVERVAPGAARFRLAGSRLIDLMGMEVRGMPLCSLLHPSSRGRLSDVLETVFAGPQIAELSLLSPPAYARPEMSGTLLLLPLRSDLGDVTRALGCLVTTGPIGTAPRRFDLITDRAEPIIEGARVLVPSASPLGFSEPPAPWKAGAPRNIIREDESPAERRARFRVISDD